jgi:hypothetical protein
LLQYGDEGAKPNLERGAIWPRQLVEQGQFFATIESADVLENGAGAAADSAKARDVLARALSAEFQTKQNNLRMTSIRPADETRLDEDSLPLFFFYL